MVTRLELFSIGTVVQDQQPCIIDDTYTGYDASKCDTTLTKAIDLEKCIW